MTKDREKQRDQEKIELIIKRKCEDPDDNENRIFEEEDEYNDDEKEDYEDYN